MKLVVATKNAGKLKEFSAILSKYGYEIISADEAGYHDDVDETGTTFEENAIIKAETIYNALKLPTVADDSGLMVDYLDGRPGVYSARYAENGKHCEKLLSELEGVPLEERNAKFVASICFIDENGKKTVVSGECKGYIGFTELGTNGFGYDPIFMCGDKSMSQMSDDEKNAISHRGNALNKLMQVLDGGKID